MSKRSRATSGCADHPRRGQTLRSAPPSCRPLFGINHPIPGSDSQSNPDFRKINRNLSLTFAVFDDTGHRRPTLGGSTSMAETRRWLRDDGNGSESVGNLTLPAWNKRNDKPQQSIPVTVSQYRKYLKRTTP